MSEKRWAAHAQACERGERMYTDPDSGFQVFTEIGLRARARCCGSGCRHCPFHHERVPVEFRARRIQRPAFLHGNPEPKGRYDVLFWSGGKDSWLAWRALMREPRPRTPILLTSFDAFDRRIAHQEVRIDTIVRQAQSLGAILLGVPLHEGREYVDQLGEGLELIPSIGRLVFGDLHLAQIRQWRENALGPLADARGATFHFPLWEQPYEQLLEDLEASEVPCTVCAVADPSMSGVALGERFGRDLIQRLPDGIDSFGERGEFHTLAEVWRREP